MFYFFIKHITMNYRGMGTIEIVHIYINIEPKLKISKAKRSIHWCKEILFFKMTDDIVLYLYTYNLKRKKIV